MNYSSLTRAIQNTYSKKNADTIGLKRSFIRSDETFEVRVKRRLTALPRFPTLPFSPFSAFSPGTPGRPVTPYVYMPV